MLIFFYLFEYFTVCTSVALILMKINDKNLFSAFWFIVSCQTYHHFITEPYNQARRTNCTLLPAYGDDDLSAKQFIKQIKLTIILELAVN